MADFKTNEIIDMKLINKETGEVVMTCPVMKVGVNKNLTVVKEKNLKEFMNYEPTIAEDDDWGQWNQDMFEWLFKPLDVGDIQMRDENDEVWKYKEWNYGGY